MDYTPPQEKTAPVAAPTYELKKDGTGEPPVKRGAHTLKDKNGQEVKLPYPPKDNCKRCRGRGYIGFNEKGRLIICKKCYPMI